MNGDDSMVVYSNYQGNDDQLQAMFDHEQFPDLTETTKSDDSLESANPRHGRIGRKPNDPSPANP
jgi:hypothetical protein